MHIVNFPEFPRMLTRRLLVLVAVVLVLLPMIMGCGVRSLRRSEVRPGGIATLPRLNTTLKAHLHDGSVLVFASWALDEPGRVVRGSGRRLDPGRQPVAGEALAVSLDSVALFESDELAVPGAIAAITLMGVVAGAVSVFCLTNPKACFGSCPTFYAWDGERQALMAEGFSASVAPALEATDLDALDRARPREGRLVLTMTNEALETHVVRQADLLLAARSPGERVLADAGGALWTTSDWRAPDGAIAAEGDCRSLLAARDGIERTSDADSSDLATRETIELRFDQAPAGPLGLAVIARQSLLSTYIFYQTLAWMGRSAGTWLASLEGTGTGTRASAFGPGRALGAIDVQVRRSGDWVTVGEFHETGPLAWDSRLVPLPDGGDAPLRVRLRMTRGMWRLDQVALASVRGGAEAVRVHPARVLRRGRPDAAALAALLGEGPPLVTQPGDTLALVYELPPAHEDAEIFLSSRGYYLEWMREQWLAEEDPARLARLFMDPGGALREMAPEFKRVEPGMEQAFWGSRYAR